MKNVNQGKETPNPETKKVEEGDTANHFPNPKREEETVKDVRKEDGQNGEDKKTED